MPTPDIFEIMVGDSLEGFFTFVFFVWSCPRATLFLDFFLLDRVIEVTASPDRPIRVKRIDAVGEAGDDEITISGEIQQACKYHFRMKGENKFERKSDALAILDKMLNISLESLWMRMIFSLFSLVLRSDGTAFFLYDANNRLLHASELGHRLIERQAGEELFVAGGDGKRIPLMAHITALIAEGGEFKIHLSDGHDYHLILNSFHNPFFGLFRLAILTPCVPLELDSLMEYLACRGLTRREREVVGLVLGGMNNGEIGAALGITAVTVRDHLHHIFKKLQVSSRLELVTGLLDLQKICRKSGAVDDTV